MKKDRFKFWMLIIFVYSCVLGSSLYYMSKKASRDPSSEVIESMEKVQILISKKLALDEAEMMDIMDRAKIIKFHLTIHENFIQL